MGQKLSSKLLFIYSPNSDGYLHIISEGSVATQLWCGGGLFRNHLIQIFRRMCQWKNFDNRSIFDKDMDKIYLLFWATLYFWSI